MPSRVRLILLDDDCSVGSDCSGARGSNWFRFHSRLAEQQPCGEKSQWDDDRPVGKNIDHQFVNNALELVCFEVSASRIFNKTSDLFESLDAENVPSLHFRITIQVVELQSQFRRLASSVCH